MKNKGKSLELGAVSSVVEHYLDTVGVTGSNPVARTTLFPLKEGLHKRLSVHFQVSFSAYPIWTYTKGGSVLCRS